MAVRIRLARVEDAERFSQIYLPYVTETSVTAETSAPDAAEFVKRFEETVLTHPWIVAEEVDGDGKARVVGYMYAHQLRPRQAYQWAAETSIYVDSTWRHGGVGRSLDEALTRLLKMQNVTNMYACVSVPTGENPYLTTNSHDFHAHIGYTQIACFHKANRKFGLWNDVTWMEKMIADHADDQKPFVPFAQLDQKKVDEALAQANAEIAQREATSAAPGHTPSAPMAS